jgi:SPP1 gp7 family putative phage head morphogenesis protein
MLKLKNKYWKPIEKEIEQHFYETFFKPLRVLFKEPIYNTSGALLSAIQEGRIVYESGIFSGRFNVRISKELSKYATYDGRSNLFRADITRVPSDILAAAIVANEKGKSLNKRLNLWINEAEKQLLDIPKSLTFAIRKPTAEMSQDMRRELVKVLGVAPEISPITNERLINDYNYNQSLSIKNWEQKEVERLRDLVSDTAKTGYRRREMEKRIMQEWKVSKKKARFLARQETSLYMSKLRREQSLAAGVRKYKWITARDERVRPATPAAKKSGANHRHLHGKIFYYGDPPVVNLKTQKRAEPGEDYNCRCTARPVVD